MSDASAAPMNIDDLQQEDSISSLTFKEADSFDTELFTQLMEQEVGKEPLVSSDDNEGQVAVDNSDHGCETEPPHVLDDDDEKEGRTEKESGDIEQEKEPTTTGDYNEKRMVLSKNGDDQPYWNEEAKWDDFVQLIETKIHDCGVDQLEDVPIGIYDGLVDCPLTNSTLGVSYPDSNVGFFHGNAPATPSTFHQNLPNYVGYYNYSTFNNYSKNFIGEIYYRSYAMDMQRSQNDYGNSSATVSSHNTGPWKMIKVFWSFDGRYVIPIRQGRFLCSEHPNTLGNAFAPHIYLILIHSDQLKEADLRGAYRLKAENFYKCPNGRLEPYPYASRNRYDGSKAVRYCVHMNGQLVPCPYQSAPGQQYTADGIRLYSNRNQPSECQQVGEKTPSEHGMQEVLNSPQACG